MELEKNYRDIIRVKDNHTWRLLASDSAPQVLALLKSVLYDDKRDRILGASAMLLKVEEGLALIRELGGDLRSPAQEYLGRWVNSGWLIRRFPPGADEEIYELSAAAIDAIRFVSNLANPKPTMTESHLAIVMHAVARLSEETDSKTERRARRLREEIARRSEELEAVESGRLGVLSEDAALERLKEIVGQAEGLTEDFRRVMDQFERLSLSFRESVHVSGESRGDILAEVFDGVYALEGTDAGRAFTAFYRLLNDEAQREALKRDLAQLAEESFFGRLDAREMALLRNLIGDLLGQAAAISSVTLDLDLGLRRFVEGPEYLKGQRMARLLQEARQAAVEARGHLGPTRRLAARLDLVRRPVMSVSQLQWTPKPPRTPIEPFRGAGPAPVDLGAVREAIGAGEIDLRTLRGNVLAVLEYRDRATVADVLDRFPAVQGLASVVGLVHLAHRHGERAPGLRETVRWTGLDGAERASRLDQWLFIKERADELKD